MRRGMGTTRSLWALGAKVMGKVLYDDGTPAAGAAVRYVYTSERGADEVCTLADANGAYEFAGVAVQGDATAPSNNTRAVVPGSSSLSAIDLRVGSPLMAEDRVCRQGGRDDQPGHRPSSRVRAVGNRGPCDHRQAVGRDRALVPDPHRPAEQLRFPSRGNGRGRQVPGEVLLQTLVTMQYREAQDGSYLIDQEWMNRDPFARQPFREQAITRDTPNVVLKLKTEEVKTLTGKVVDEAGKPVAAAKVFHSYRVPAVVTDAAGSFTLRTVPKAKAFQICVLSPASDRGAVVPVALDADQVNIVLQPTAHCDGLVTTPAGLPAGDLKFTMDVSMSNGQLYQLGQSLTTHVQGRFRARHLISGLGYRVSWNAENEQNRDYDSGNAQIDPASDVTNQ